MRSECHKYLSAAWRLILFKAFTKIKIFQQSFHQTDLEMLNYMKKDNQSDSHLHSDNIELEDLCLEM